MVPKDTAENYRYYNDNEINRQTQNTGTPTNIILGIAKEKKVKYLGDFHAAKPNDLPGKNVIFYYTKSYNVAEYIGDETGIPIERPVELTGMLTTQANNAGIVSFICEVLSATGKVRSGSADLSYEAMISFLTYTEEL